MELTKRQNEIIDASVRLIARRGIPEFTIKNLAAEIGVTEPALYRHFPNKAEIVRTMIARFGEEIPTGRSRKKGVSAIRAFFDAHVGRLLAEPALAKVMFCEEYFISDPDFSEQMAAMMHRHKEWMEARLVEGIGSGHIRSDIPSGTLFHMTVGPMRMLFKQWGMSGMKFDLRTECGRQLDALELLLKPCPAADSTAMRRKTAKRN